MVSLPTHICVARPQWVKKFGQTIPVSPVKRSNIMLQIYCENHLRKSENLPREFLWPTTLADLPGPGSKPNSISSLRPRQNGRHFADDVFKCIFLNENVWISLKISLKFVPKGPINNIPALVQIMAWRRPGDKPLSEPMMVSLPTHICVTRPQWVSWPPILLVCRDLQKRFPHYWPFVRGIHRWPVHSPLRGTVTVDRYLPLTEGQ